MFLKLLKHESHATARALMPLMGGLLLVALLARGSIWLTQNAKSNATNIISVLLIAMFVLGCIAIVVTTMILMMNRFKKSVFSDEGYLTHTLPVNTSSILLCHLLLSFAGILLSFVTVYAGIRLVTLNVGAADDFSSFSTNLFSQMGIEKITVMLQFFGLMAMSILTTILMLFAAISIGHSFATGKTGKSVLFFFILYFVQQMLTSIVMVAVTAMQFATTGEMQNPTFNTFSAFWFWFSTGAYLFFGLIYYFLTWFMTKKHLNLS